MDKLILERTQPIQGQRVGVKVKWNDVAVGGLSFEFKAWLKFKRLLELGMEMDARADHGLDLKLVVRGPTVEAVGDPYTTKTKEEPIRVPLTELLGEDDEDTADLAAIEAAEAGTLPPTVSEAQGEADFVTQGLIRSLRRENADD